MGRNPRNPMPLTVDKHVGSKWREHVVTGTVVKPCGLLVLLAYSHEA